MTSLLDQSCRVALTTFIYCLDNFAAKAELPTVCCDLSKKIHTYLPHYTQLDLESLKPIIEEAERIASAGGKEEITKTGLGVLFENISLTENNSTDKKEYSYPLKAISAENIFPVSAQTTTQHQYEQLWEELVKGLEAIPYSHRHRLDLWLDHFDTALQCFMTNVPSPINSVSLYDYTKTTVALTTALWCWQQENPQTSLSQAEPFLLIQGDFFGIQDFIFSGGSDTNKEAAKLLRGRSFQVSLFTELAALKVLEQCQLPSSSQIMNAAGKFLIVASNTQAVRNAIEQVQQELNQWFIKHTFGLVGLGIAVKSANSEQFMENKFSEFHSSLFKALEEKKLQRLDLTETTESVQDITYPYGVCRLNSYFPAENTEDGKSFISADQIEIGKQLTAKKRIIVCNEKTEISAFGKTEKLNLAIFGYRILFTEKQEETGKFGELAKNQNIVRFWDFSLPETMQAPLWNGYARRYINAYIALFNSVDQYSSEKYKNIEEENKQIKVGRVKTFDYLACEDRILDSKGKFIGQDALMTLKGDVDNLGSIFQKGLKTPSFAKMATLSRQMNQFFSLWLPAYCNQAQLNVYTVFAGGDDFFLIGAWHSIQKLAVQMQESFAKYVAENKEIHFSVGMVMTKVGMPVPRLGELAEEALEKAKKMDGKNAVTLYQQSIFWEKYKSLNGVEKEIARLSQDYSISTSYLYSLMYFAEQAQNENQIENTMWRSRFYYKTARYVIDKLKKEDKDKALNQITLSLGDKGIAEYKNAFIIPLFNYFYQQRH